MATITLRGKEYPILFDLNVVELIQQRYGDVAKLGEKISNISEQKWILTKIINEGIEFDNFINNRSNKTLTEPQVGMLLSVASLQNGELSQKIVDAFNECLGDEKNLTAEEIVEQAKPN